MCPGVGKTRALREAALAKKRAGVEVLQSAQVSEAFFPPSEAFPADKFPVWNGWRGAIPRKIGGGERPLLIWGDLREALQPVGNLPESSWSLEELRRCLESGLDVFCTANVSGILSMEGGGAEQRGEFLGKTVEGLFADYLGEMRWVDMPPWQLRSRMEEFPERFCALRERWGDALFERENLEVLRARTAQVMGAYWVGRWNMRERKRRAPEKESDTRVETENRKDLSVAEGLQGCLMEALAHELKGPVAILVAGLEAAQPEWGALKQAAERLRRTVEHLLDSARLDSLGAELRREWCEVAELVQEALQISAPGRREVRVAIPEQTPLVLVDGRLISQALSTLISNALAYSPAHEPVEIEVEVRGADSGATTVHLQIRDRGPGVPTGLEERVFERFYRCPGTPPGGLGLGLSIARQLVESHGGTVSMENRREGGALFMISLPVPRGVSFPREITP